MAQVSRQVSRPSGSMPAFQHAQNFVVSNSVFTDQNIYCQAHISGIDVLRESSAPEAAFDSDSRRYAPSCFPGTRSQYIEDIVNWATAQSSFPIYRMTGPAGVGKSAIAQTCAEELRSRHQLGASFFFTIDGCSDYSRFFPSISYQLSSKSPDYHELLNKKLQLDSTLVKKQLKSQFRELIVEPLRELEQAGKHVGRKVILVDGLDECKDKDAQREIIEIVISSVASHSTPFYWAFFSRPEPQIEAAFVDHRVASLCISTFLPVSRGIDGEIELYLRSGLRDILRRRGVTTSTPWPSDEDMYILVSMAKGLYIYAATVLRFVGRNNTQYDPQELLRIVINASLRPSNDGVRRSPFEELDTFYTLILQRVPNELHSPVQLFLSLMAIDHVEGEKPVRLWIHYASNALRFTETKMKMLCGELVAVVFRARVGGRTVTKQDPSSLDATLDHGHLVSSPLLSPLEDTDTQDEWLGFYHKSFFDFLCDPIRSGPFCVTTPAIHNKLFQHLVELQVNYSTFYSFQSSRDLSLEAGESNRSANVHDVLSWRSDSELSNSIMRDYLFELVGILLLDKFFPYEQLDNQLLRRFGHVHHRKHLMMQSWTFEENVHVPGTTFGFGCVIKSVQGTILCSTTCQDMPSFDAERFRKGISRLEGAQVIQRYQPNSTTLALPLFRCDSDGNALSGLYIKGRDEMSTFWYWVLDPETNYYRDFETADLAEGEKIFREEKFELWVNEDEENVDEENGDE